MTKLPESLGFREGTSSVHTSRTMMLGELSLVLEHVAPKAKVEEYMVAIAEGQRRLTRGEFRQFLGQAGDTRKENDTQSIDQLTQELAYEYWHRMLFARFLAENHLLMHPDGVAVSLEECEELARDVDPPAPNGFVLAARYASTMLPQSFRSDDVLLEIDFSPEHRLALEKLLTSLPQVTFLADDSLGWVYQFWQSKRKKEVNESGNKIGANELPSVTQMFTEDYMVDFLLDNTLAFHPTADGASRGFF